MKDRTKVIIAFIIMALLVLFLRPTRLYLKSFYSGLFSKNVQIMDYNQIPISQDTIYRKIKTGQFESDTYFITRTDSSQVIFDKKKNTNWNYNIKWVNENEYYLFDSIHKMIIKNKIVSLTDTSFTLIFSYNGYETSRSKFKILKSSTNFLK